MEKLEQRVRQLEGQLIAEQFKNAILMDKLEISIDDLKSYAKACLETLPESEKNTDIHYYLLGILKGKEITDTLHE